MIRLYKAYVLPHLEYCSPLLLGISNGLKNKLEDTIYYILSTILRYSSSVFYDFLLNFAELQNLETRRLFQSLVILYKCLRGQGPEYLSEFFNVLNVNYNLRGASTRLMLPSFNLEYMHKSWSYLTTKLWNGLPTKVRECPDLAAFKATAHTSRYFFGRQKIFTCRVVCGEFRQVCDKIGACRAISHLKTSCRALSGSVRWTKTICWGSRVPQPMRNCHQSHVNKRLFQHGGDLLGPKPKRG